ncbi:MAG: glycosyltransferase family 39 protein [Verrucomicrobiota bacterium]|nr:glycosyltransferase family 39 protein [Verrucomicrobiota bacterium]
MVEATERTRGWKAIFASHFWRRRRLHLVVLVWAIIYLPFLGSHEIQGEEGRRILPAVTMLQTGNYLVPHVGSEPYFRKPPLINWIIAASFKLTGIRNEWTARLPSALCILAVALAFITIGRGALGESGAFIAALIWLTFGGSIEKGRQIEIEALYVSATALAFICWLAAYRAGRGGMRLWFWPAVFLGLGALAKGPLPHLLFFYGPVIALLWHDRKLSLLLRPAHVLALLIIFGIFCAWALPMYLVSDRSRMAVVWSKQVTGRVAGVGFQLGSWITNIPRSLAYFLPWVLLGVLQIGSADDRKRSRYFLAGIAVPFVAMNLVPVALPRYAMPAMGATAWWLAELLCAPELHWPRWLSGSVFNSRRRDQVIALVVVLMTLGGFAYAVARTPRKNQTEKVRKYARQIDAVVPAGVPVFAVNPEYQPYLFYLRGPVLYASSLDELPADTLFFMVRARDENEAATTTRWSPRRTQMVLHMKDYRGLESILFAVVPR